MKALIIEDSEYERTMICAFLKLMGFSAVVERTTLKQAIIALEKEKFDLITLDLKLQDSTPESTLASLPVIASYAGNTPIVVATGHPSAITPCAMKCAQSLLRKPYQYNDFKQAIESAMKSRKYRPMFPVAMLMIASLGQMKTCNA